MERIDISDDAILKALWFTCASASQIFERTSKSRINPVAHLWRIFSGKVGELAFVKFLYENRIINFSALFDYEKESLSVYWGKHNVDSYDLKIGNFSIDIKTLPESHYKYLIIPADQYANQPKDLYVAVQLDHNFTKKDKSNLFTLSCLEIYQLMCMQNLQVIRSMVFRKIRGLKILGYTFHDNPAWEYEEKGVNCPEYPCYKIPVSKLEPTDSLLMLLKG